MVNHLQKSRTDRSVPQQAVAAVMAPRESMDARARKMGTHWYYEFLTELLRNGILVRHVSQLNKDCIDNLLDVPALSDSGVAVNCDQDKTWRVVSPQGKVIVMEEFAGSWSELEVSTDDIAHSQYLSLRLT